MHARAEEPHAHAEEPHACTCRGASHFMRNFKFWLFKNDGFFGEMFDVQEVPVNHFMTK